MSKAELSVIIPSRRPGRPLEALLASLARQQQAPCFEVIVVANPPAPAFERTLKSHFPNGLLDSSAPDGANRARNRGIDLATAPVLLFLDDDCRLTDPHFLRKHLSAHHNRPEATCIGGTYECSPSASRLDRTYNRIQCNWLEQGYTPRMGANYLLGGNFSAKASRLGALRFDPEIRFGGTETELFWRLKVDGHDLQVNPDLAVEHDSQLTLSQFISKGFHQGIGARYLAERRKSFPEISWGPVRKMRDPVLPVAETAFILLHDLAFHCGKRFFRYCGSRNASPCRSLLLATSMLITAIVIFWKKKRPSWVYNLLQALRAGKEIGKR